MRLLAQRHTFVVRWVDRLGRSYQDICDPFASSCGAKSPSARRVSLRWPGTFLPADRQRHCQSMLGKSASFGEVARTTGHTRQTVYRIKGDPVAQRLLFISRALRPEVIPPQGSRKSLQDFSAELMQRGRLLNERVRPYSAESIAAMLRRGSVVRRPPIAPPV